MNFRFTLFCILLLSGVTEIVAQSDLWSPISESSITRQTLPRVIVPNNYDLYEVDVQALYKELTSIHTSNGEWDLKSGMVLSIPIPGNRSETFEIYYAPVLHPDLAAKYPGIHSYTGHSMDRPNVTIRCDISSKGFRAMILSPGESDIFIDPYSPQANNFYIVYHKKELQIRSGQVFECHTESARLDPNDLYPGTERIGGDCQLRRYRLALACTGEYAQYHGGTVASVLAEMNTAMTRVNGIYERDLAVTMQIIASNEDLIFFNSNTDPYTNNSGGTMLGENQATIDNLIGSANYDVGHVFSTGGGGIASLRSPCNGNRKARGVTGLPNPVNDPFYVDYAAHEFGHQFGANHSFNNACGGARAAGAAMEPGSGSTIMSYAGICGPNVQNNSDAYFHAISLEEIYGYVTFGQGNSCAEIVALPNTQPEVVAGLDKTIPIGTPFELTATGLDDDGDQLTYCWEQMDNEIADMPPESNSIDGPAFRTFDPETSPTRVFPNINAIRNGQNPTWEVTPETSRNMSFRATVRDNRPLIGCTDEDDLDLQFTDESGPFIVQEPNTNVEWFVGQRVNITWDIANTNQAPVNADNVDIFLSLDGGRTYPISLANGVPNNGSAEITVPNTTSTDCRIKVKGTEHYFFDISDRDFRIIEPPEPIFLLDLSTRGLAACATDTLIEEVELIGLGGFDEEVNISLDGLPQGIEVAFSQNPVIPSDTVIIEFTNLDLAIAGNYQIVLTAESLIQTTIDSFNLTIYDELVSVPNLNFPEKGAIGQDFDPTLLWDSIPNASDYILEMALNPSFEDIIYTDIASKTSAQLLGLEPFKIYYWRIRPLNDCGVGDYSKTSSFQTTDNGCRSVNSEDTPLDISDDGASTISTYIDFAEDLEMTDVDLFIDIDHNELSDLSISLFSPAGTVISVLTRACAGGTTINAIFDDEGGAFDCSGPGITGNIQPENGTLSTFNAESSLGEWRLLVRDGFSDNGGVIDGWRLDICGNTLPVETPERVDSAELITLRGDTELVLPINIQINSPNTSDSLVQFTLTGLPESGWLVKNSDTLNIGDTFNQIDIRDSLLVYHHDSSMLDFDTVIVDITDGVGAWLPEQKLAIHIVENTLAIDSIMVENVSCFGDNDGTITVFTSGGNPVLLYRINMDSLQIDNVFDGLSPGTYDITVADRFGFLVDSIGIEVKEPDSLQLAFQQDGDIIEAVVSGGTPPYTYSLDSMNFQTEPVFEGLPDDAYTLYVMDANGCMETIPDIIVNTSSVTNLDNSDDLSVYPNPSSDRIFIEIYNLEKIDSGIFQMYSTGGVSVLKEEITLEPDTPVTINLDGISNGSYIFQIDLQSGVYHGMIVVQR